MQKHIYCSAAITPKMHDVFVSFILSQNDITEYVIYLTSIGGVPFVGFNLYSFIKSRPEETTVYNMGNVDSAAVQFFSVLKNGLVHQLAPSWFTKRLFQRISYHKTIRSLMFKKP